MSLSFLFSDSKVSRFAGRSKAKPAADSCPQTRTRARPCADAAALRRSGFAPAAPQFLRFTISHFRRICNTFLFSFFRLRFFHAVQHLQAYGQCNEQCEEVGKHLRELKPEHRLCAEKLNY